MNKDLSGLFVFVHGSVIFYFVSVAVIMVLLGVLMFYYRD